MRVRMIDPNQNLSHNNNKVRVVKRLRKLQQLTSKSMILQGVSAHRLLEVRNPQRSRYRSLI